MAVLPVQIQPRNGRDDSVGYTAAAASDTFENDGNTVVLVKNTNGATRTVSVTPSQLHGGGASPLATAAATAFTIPAIAGSDPGESIIGPLDRDKFGTTVTLTPSATAGMSYAVYRLPPPV